MEKLIEAVENLKKILNEDEIIIELKKLNQKIQTDDNLIKLLKDYQNYPKEELKKQILKNTLFQTYKEKETDLNIKILYINNKLKELTEQGKCDI